MSAWNTGYITDIGYTFGYYTELNPLRIKLAFLNNGRNYPECGSACDLGFGQETSRVAGTTAKLLDDFFARDNLPDFDYSQHGIWSWVNDANRP